MPLDRRVVDAGHRPLRRDCWHIPDGTAAGMETGLYGDFHDSGAARAGGDRVPADKAEAVWVTQKAACTLSFQKCRLLFCCHIPRRSRDSVCSVCLRADARAESPVGLEWLHGSKILGAILDNQGGPYFYIVIHY